MKELLGFRNVWLGLVFGYADSVTGPLSAYILDGWDGVLLIAIPKAFHSTNDEVKNICFTWSG